MLPSWWLENLTDASIIVLASRGGDLILARNLRLELLPSLPRAAWPFASVQARWFPFKLISSFNVVPPLHMPGPRPPIPLPI